MKSWFPFSFLVAQDDPGKVLLTQIRRRVIAGEKRVRIAKAEMATLLNLLDSRQQMICEQGGGVRVDGAMVYSE